MQYLLLIHSDETREPGTEEERNAMFGEYFAFSDSIRDQTVEAAPLEPSTASTTVRVRDGETLVTDGPFAETKEQLGGFYVIDVPGEAEALEWASKMPNLPHGSVEVRPVMLYD